VLELSSWVFLPLRIFFLPPLSWGDLQFKTGCPVFTLHCRHLQSSSQCDHQHDLPDLPPRRSVCAVFGPIRALPPRFLWSLRGALLVPPLQSRHLLGGSECNLGGSVC